MAVTLLRAFGDERRADARVLPATALVAAGLGVLTAVVAWLLPGSSSAAPDSADLDAFEVEEGMLAAAGLEDLEWVGRDPKRNR